MTHSIFCTISPNFEVMQDFVWMNLHYWQKDSYLMNCLHLKTCVATSILNKPTDRIYTIIINYCTLIVYVSLERKRRITDFIFFHWMLYPLYDVSLKYIVPYSTVKLFLILVIPILTWLSFYP